MHISVFLFWGFIFGVAALGFAAGYFFNRLFRDEQPDCVPEGERDYFEEAMAEYESRTKHS